MEVRAGIPAVLLWNVGINHHVGPYRFNVDLARQLAKQGVISLRFDLSGRGDSEIRRDSMGEMERSLDDLREAAALLTKRKGQQHFIPVGFCSSVDAAHQMALVDDRVIGACFIEGYAHRTPQFFLRYPLRLLDRTRWRRAAAGRLPKALREARWFQRLGRIPFGVPEDDVVYVRNYPSPTQLRRDYGVLTARGTRMLFVYAGGDSSYNHAAQLFEFADAPRLREHVEIEYIRQADHMFYLPSDRERVIGRICGWLEQTFARSP
jgi:dienelactone hydrolase